MEDPCCPFTAPIADAPTPLLDDVPRRGIDWDLFWNGSVWRLEAVDCPDEREERLYADDDEAAAFVLYWACAPEYEDEEEKLAKYAPVRVECREALRELVAFWDSPFPPDMP
jgi:hypothetical protein